MPANQKFFEKLNVDLAGKQSAVGNLKSSIHQNSAPRNPAQNSGDNSVVVPPVPIPNTEVKRYSPDGSTAIGRARVGRRQSKMPGGNSTGHFVSAPPFWGAHAARVLVKVSSPSRTCIRRAPANAEP
jgi:hypothetical protein